MPDSTLTRGAARRLRLAASSRKLSARESSRGCPRSRPSPRSPRRRFARGRGGRARPASITPRGPPAAGVRRARRARARTEGRAPSAGNRAASRCRGPRRAAEGVSAPSPARALGAARGRQPDQRRARGPDCDRIRRRRARARRAAAAGRREGPLCVASKNAPSAASHARARTFLAAPRCKHSGRDPRPRVGPLGGVWGGLKAAQRANYMYLGPGGLVCVVALSKYILT